MPAADHQNVRIDGTIDVVVTDDETEADLDREAEIEAVDETDTDRDREAATEAADETDTKQYVQNLLQFLANLEKHTPPGSCLLVPKTVLLPKISLSLSFISYPLEQKKT
jgi:hypothetical protein